MAFDDGDDVRALRRSLRDVIALTTLPSIWSGYDAGQIAADAADLVEYETRLNFLLPRYKDPVI